MGVPDRKHIEDEIKRLESRRAEIERELNLQSSLTRLRFLSEDLILMNRTLIVLRQQHARHLVPIDARDAPSN